MQNLSILNLQGDHVRGHTNFGSISSVVLTFIGHRQTDKQAKLDVEDKEFVLKL